MSPTPFLLVDGSPNDQLLTVYQSLVLDCLLPEPGHILILKPDILLHNPCCLVDLIGLVQVLVVVLVLTVKQGRGWGHNVTVVLACSSNS